MPTTNSTARILEDVETSLPFTTSDPKEIERQDPATVATAPDKTTAPISLEAWLQVLASFIVWFNTVGATAAVGEWLAYYQTTLLAHNKPWQNSWIAATQGTCFLLFGILAGPMFDRGYLRSLLISGTVITTFGFMMTSIAHNLWQIILAQGLVTGLGMSLLWTPSLSVVSQWFPNVEQRNMANALSSVGSGLGGLFYSSIFRAIQVHSGWRWATRACGFFILGSSLLATWIHRRRTPHQRPRALIETEAFREPAWCLTCLAAFLGYIAQYLPVFYVAPWAVEHKYVSVGLSYYVLAIFHTAGTFGRLIMAVLAVRVTGVLNMIVIVCATFAVLSYSWLAVDSSAGAIVIIVVLGWWSGAATSVIPLLPVVMTKDFSKIGTRMGMAMFFASCGLFTGAPSAAALITYHSKNYDHMFEFMGAVYVATGLTVVAIIYTQVGFKLAKI